VLRANSMTETWLLEDGRLICSQRRRVWCAASLSRRVAMFLRGVKVSDDGGPVRAPPTPAPLRDICRRAVPRPIAVMNTTAMG